MRVEQKTILVVDDEPGVIEILQINLEYEGYRVIGVSQGLDALEKIRAENPDLLILDVMMPGMNGWQVLERMGADPKMAQIPVIMLTVLAEDMDVVKGLEKGAVEFITKPFNLVHLVGAVKLLLENPDRRSQEAHRQRLMAERKRLMKPLHDLFPEKHEQN